MSSGRRPPRSSSNVLTSRRSQIQPVNLSTSRSTSQRSLTVGLTGDEHEPGLLSVEVTLDLLDHALAGVVAEVDFEPDEALVVDGFGCREDRVGPPKLPCFAVSDFSSADWRQEVLGDRVRP